MHLNDPVFGTVCQSEKAQTHSTSLANEKKSFGFLHPQPECHCLEIFLHDPPPYTQKAIFENLVQQLIFEVQVVAKIITGILQNNKLFMLLYVIFHQL